MPHRTEYAVTWGDTDAGGLIYYPRFFHFVIVGLNDYFAPAVDGAHPMEWLRTGGLTLPAVDASASFESPLRAGDAIVIETEVVDFGEASVTVAFAVERRSNGERTASGEVTFVLVDDQWEATPLPDAFRACVGQRGDLDEGL